LGFLFYNDVLVFKKPLKNSLAQHKISINKLQRNINNTNQKAFKEKHPK
jgi:hypothetical protein